VGGLAERAIGDLPGLGPKTELWLREVGIHTEGELRAIGAVAAYRRLKFWNPRLVSLNALYALHGALNGLPRHAIDEETKARLRKAAADPPGTAVP
jgi:DNA transformation protein and related proteins